jgi:hypothetical protein
METWGRGGGGGGGKGGWVPVEEIGSARLEAARMLGERELLGQGEMDFSMNWTEGLGLIMFF